MPLHRLIEATDKRPCDVCGERKNFSKFGNKRNPATGEIEFLTVCKSCLLEEQKKRNGSDRARQIMRRRAKSHASRLGVSIGFMWVEMNWRHLVPYMRGMLAEGASCLSCGECFRDEQDITIDHGLTPRDLPGGRDFAREHAMNIALRCASCNKSKKDTDLSAWFDALEAARVRHGETPPTPLVRRRRQLSFDFS